MTNKSARTTLTVASILPHCQYRTPSGRRCRLSIAANSAHFCIRHVPPPAPAQLVDQTSDLSDTTNFFTFLATDYHDFQTAQGINHSLRNLYELLAKGRISPRRAAILAYISSLVLRTLPQIDADNAAGIKFHPKNKLVPATISPAAPCAAPSDEAQPISNSIPDSNPANTWALSQPEPDPAKKPS